MRLVCPNCDAEYEVDDAAIPQTGRDVQCSNCGHAWFQSHPERVDEEADALTPLAVQDSAAEDPIEDLAGKDAVASAMTDVTPAGAAGSAEPEESGFELPPADDLAAQRKTDGGAPVPAVDPVPQAAAETASATRNIDESVLAVLREEAAREVAARRAETPAPALETQTEMRLAPSAAAVSAAAANTVVARLKGQPEPKPEAAAARPRRDLLPAIEEINSTLRASSGRSGDVETVQGMADAAQASRGRFGSGFLTLILLAVVLLALYILAPVIADKVPALARVLTAYVAAVDAARISLDSHIRSLIGMLRGLEGRSQG